MSSSTAASEFAAFFAATRLRLLRLLAAVTADVGEAEDALQEAYVRAAARWKLLDEPEAWVRRVALNAARDAFRKREVRDRARDSFATRHRHDEAAAPTPDRVVVVAALRALPQPLREVLALHYLLDMSVEQIARELDRPAGTVKAQLVRGRERLAAVLDMRETR